MDTYTVKTAGAEIVYDVRGALPPVERRPPLVMGGTPMDASGFAALAERFTERTVVTYDPRGLGRSPRSDGRVDHTPEIQAEDVHAVIEAIGGGPVEFFASSGGAITALALVAKYPGDVSTLVAHEPPVLRLLPDAEAAVRVRDGYRAAYDKGGWGAGMAAFLATTSWEGEFTDAFFAQPAPDPTAFGMPAEDDGKRDDPLLSDRSMTFTDYRPDANALAAAPTRLVIAVGEETGNTLTFRTGQAIAALLGQEAVVFPSHHGGFLDGESGYPGKPDEFAVRLREVLREVG